VVPDIDEHYIIFGVKVKTWAHFELVVQKLSDTFFLIFKGNAEGIVSYDILANSRFKLQVYVFEPELNLHRDVITKLFLEDLDVLFHRCWIKLEALDSK